MYKKIKRTILILCILIIYITPIKVNANDYSINDLIENGKSFDKKEVTLKGEAIGESLKRDDYTWININDTTNAIGIYMTTNDANKVNVYGGYSKDGDILQVTGIFNRACKEHGGDMDIHSSKVEIIKVGKEKKETIKKEKIYVVFISSIIVALLMYIIYKNKKK